MSTEDAHDVTKALAAFGAPSIRYHSFGQGQVRPSSVVMPRREPVAPLPLQPLGPLPTAAAPAAPLVRQAEPDAAPEPQWQAVPLPPIPPPSALAVSPMPPVPAFRRTIDPATILARPTPMPPPRPLSDRPLGSLVPSATIAPAAFAPAAPNPNAPPPATLPPPPFVTPTAPLTASAAAMITPTMATAPRAPTPSPAPTASLGPLPTPSQPAPRPMADFIAPVATIPRAAPMLGGAIADRPIAAEHSTPVAPSDAKMRNLKEIFTLLASAPSAGTASPRI